MEKIKEFLKIDFVSGDGSGAGAGAGAGYGSGAGAGAGAGYGDGDGAGSGAGYGDGAGDGAGSGAGYGYGAGYGDGDGAGSGSGAGYGDGYGDGYGIQSLNGNLIYNIDNVLTIIKKLKNNVARGFILNDDLTLEPCVVVKSNYMFAHGENLHKAMESLQEKLFDGMTTEERIDAFMKEFNLTDKYPAQKFFEWHNKLTGSCEMGRKSFAKNNNIDLESDTFTVHEFIEKTRYDYGRDIIRALEKKVSDEKY